MKTEICSSCSRACSINVESGKFDADGPTGTIRGNMGDLEISDCCGYPVEEIDSDLFEYWEEVKNIAREEEVFYFIADSPGDYRDRFEAGVTAREAVNSSLPF